MKTRDRVLFELVLDFSIALIGCAIAYQYHDPNIVYLMIGAFIAGYIMKDHRMIKIGVEDED